MKRQKKKKWTIFFLIKSVDDSTDELITMMNEIRSLEFNNNFLLIFCIHILRKNIDALVAGDASLLDNNPGKKNYTVVFYLLEQDIEEAKLPNKLRLIRENPDFDLTNKKHLKEFFKEQILNNYQAKRYILFTWDHGKAFGIFSGEQNENHSIIPTENIATIKMREQANEKILTMEELANAIRWAFGEKKIDLLIMMNCIMQVVDTGYALQNSIKYLIASQIAMDYNGYNYPFFFQLILNTPNISTKKLAKHVISSFPKKVFPSFSMGNYQKYLSTISCCDLRRFALLEKLIDRLADYLKSQIEMSKTDILSARANSIVDSVSNQIDIYTFLSYIERLGLFKEDTLLASLILSIKDLIIIKTYIGKGFTDEIGLSKIRPSGLSIFFPLLLATGEYPQPSLQQTLFFKRSNWKTFLSKITKD